jgi:FKBP-type peptidyl-prolyl cis-trans isomerase FkpA
LKKYLFICIVLLVGNLYSQEPADLVIEDKLIGTGTEALAGKKVTVHYSGFLTNGTMFDSSIPRKTPFTFILGAGEVIQGWDRGVVGMKVGGKRKLTIPSKYGYGARGAGNVIPPNATLIFDVELLKVEK